MASTFFTTILEELMPLNLESLQKKFLRFHLQRLSTFLVTMRSDMRRFLRMHSLSIKVILVTKVPCTLTSSCQPQATSKSRLPMLTQMEGLREQELHSHLQASPKTTGWSSELFPKKLALHCHMTLSRN